MKKLHINKNKVSILKDFPARFPYIYDKTCTCEMIIERFVNVDMLDAKHNFWLYFYAILKTRRISITRSEMQNIEKHFSQFFKIHTFFYLRCNLSISFNLEKWYQSQKIINQMVCLLMLFIFNLL